MPRPSRPRVSPRLVIAVLALGALANVAVAWTCALTIDLGRADRFTERYRAMPDGRHWEVYRWDRLAGARVFSKCWSGPAAGPYNHGDPGELLARWGRIVPPDPASRVQAAGVDEAWGVPLRAFRSALTATRTPAGVPVSERSGMLVLRPADGLRRRALHLPLRPVWSGLLLNTLFYALLAVVVAAAARDLRAVLRGRRATAVAPA